VHWLTLGPRMTTPESAVRRILIVDDEPLICDSIMRILALDQHEVETATSGHAALAAFQAGKFDLVIIDYEMPGMKGDKLAGAIRTAAPQQRIIMMTAYGESLRMAGDFPLPVDQVMGKPFDAQQLREAVRQITGKA
jgi:DNA-binding response OmpR family regulator